MDESYNNPVKQQYVYYVIGLNNNIINILLLDRITIIVITINTYNFKLVLYTCYLLRYTYTFNF